MIGKTLGPYRILEKIGRGGMAAVYKAYQPSLDRYVAVKVLPSHLTDEAGFAERFKREARAVARLEHPHILPVYDYGQEGDLTYIAMRYVEGGTLKDLLGKPVELPLVVDLIGQMGEALDYAHEHGVIHRDVKPSNVLLDRGNWTLLTDFGVARMVEATQQLTGTGVGVGTPAYMSPEQGQGKKVDRRSDVYSLGVVLYEMLTGRVPFEAETPLAVVWKHANEPLPLPRGINPEIPEAVESVVLKAMAKAPADRFQTAGELAKALWPEMRASSGFGALSRRVRESQTADVLPTRKPWLVSLYMPRRALPLIAAISLLGVAGAAIVTTVFWREPAADMPLIQDESVDRPATALASPIENANSPAVQTATVTTASDPSPNAAEPTPPMENAIVRFADEFAGMAYGFSSHGHVEYTDDTAEISEGGSITLRTALSEGTGMLFLLRHDPGEFNVYLANRSAAWDSYIGVKTSTGYRIITSVGFNNRFIGGESLEGELSFTPGQWYFVLVRILPAGTFYIRVWEKDNPLKFAEKGLRLGDEWAASEWFPHINVTNGRVSVDYYQELTFE